jgi:hypothetical protein
MTLIWILLGVVILLLAIAVYITPQEDKNQ